MILDPTGNITALAESPVSIEEQPAAARKLMLHHPEVEQVGFVRFAPPDGNGVSAALRMAGGEFCGNASMSAAALCLLRDPEKEAEELRIRASGAAQPQTRMVSAAGRSRSEMQGSADLTQLVS